MVFKKKPKKVAKKENESETLETQDVGDELDVPTPPEAPPLTEEELRVQDFAQAFANEYDGVVQFGTDGVRANLLFALFSEQRKTNELLEELLAVAREE